MAAVGENTHVTDEDVAAFLRAKAASRTKQDAEIVVMFARYIFLVKEPVYKQWEAAGAELERQHPLHQNQSRPSRAIS